MDSTQQLPGWNKNISYWLKHVEKEEEDNELRFESALPNIPQPETPKEPMEFLSRSWSLSASEIIKAISQKQMHHHYQPAFDHTHLSAIPEADLKPIAAKPVQERARTGSAIGRLFHHKELNDNSKATKKDKERIENAHTHAVLSVTGLAAATALAANKYKDPSSKMSVALASATEILASYCIELAESSIVDHDRVVSVVRSGVGIRTASDLLTLTAAAATALRGETALVSRLPKETKRRASSISPYEKGVFGYRSPAAFCKEVEEDDLPCVGDLLQLTRKGVLRWKNAHVCINKTGQVIIKLKSRHIGGAFSKTSKCIVYEVIDQNDAWPFRKERENMELFFGVKTAQGLLEFKCKNRLHKQKWVQGIHKLLVRKNCIEEAEDSLRMLNINKSI